MFNEKGIRFRLRRVQPVINVAFSRLGCDLGPRNGARDVSVLCPREVRPVSPPVFLPGQLERATAVIPGAESLARELDLARRTEESHEALIQYTLRNCLVHEAGFDGPGVSFRKQPLSRLGFLSEPTRHIPEAIYCMSNPAHLYFGDWLLGACATALLARGGQARILDVRPQWPNAAQYVHSLGLQPAAPGQYVVDRLMFHQDYSLGPSKRDRWEEMRRRLGQAIPDSPSAAAPVFLRRGDGGASRTIADENGLIDVLVREGFEVADTGGSSVQQIHQRLRRAPVVVSMEGSHLCHAYLAMPTGSLIVVLVPADRFTMVQLGYARAVGLRFAFLVVTPSPGGGYEVDAGDLLRTIELAL